MRALQVYRDVWYLNLTSPTLFESSTPIGLRKYSFSLTIEILTACTKLKTRKCREIVNFLSDSMYDGYITIDWPAVARCHLATRSI